MPRLPMLLLSCTAQHAAGPLRRCCPVAAGLVRYLPQSMQGLAWRQRMPSLAPGDSIQSRMANWAINTPWMFSIMKLLAKNQMKTTADSKGVNWDAHVARMQATTPELEAIKAELERPDIVYPDYYLRPFHAYDDGNLSWLAAHEVEPATYAVALRAFLKFDASLTPQAAFRRLAGGATDALTEYSARHGLPPPRTIVDMGCSVGMSTRWLAEQFPDADITGVDLSPYFLAVAEWEERRRHAAQAGSSNAGGGASNEGRRRIKYVHDIAEHTRIESGSVDWLLFQYVIHECPQQTCRDFIATAVRVLRPGGMLAFVDNNPRSKTIQGLPPAIATLMKSTEPWSDEYFSFDVEGSMRDGGFREVVTVEIDHRHRAVMGIRS